MTHLEEHFSYNGFINDANAPLQKILIEENIHYLDTKSILKSPRYKELIIHNYHMAREVFPASEISDDRCLWLAAGELRASLFMLAIHLGGRQIYVPSQGLAERLDNTELRGMMVEDLKLPFNAFYIELPASFDRQVYNLETGHHRLRGIYVTVDSGLEFDERKGLSIMLVGAGKEGPRDDATYYFRVPLVSGESIEDMLDMSAERIEQFCDQPENVPADLNICKEPVFPAKGASGASMDNHGQSEAVWRDTFGWLMKFILYVTSADARTEVFSDNKEYRDLSRRINNIQGKSRKRERLKERRKDLNPNHRIYVGRNISLLKINKNGRPTTPSLKTLVAGHFQHYWVGSKQKGTQKRNLRWKEPYWKGEVEDTSSAVVRCVV